MPDALEAARRFNEFWGPLALWAMNNWQLFLAGFFILAMAIGLANRAQQINDRNALARAIVKAGREAK